MHNKDLKQEIITYYQQYGKEKTLIKYNINKSVLYKWTNPDKAMKYNSQSLSYMTNYKNKNKEKIKEIQRKTYKKRKIKKLIYQRKYYNSNKIKCNENRNKWAEKNKKHLDEYCSKYFSNSDVLFKQRQWKLNNPEKIKEYQKKFYRENYQKILEYNRKRRALKIQINEEYTPSDKKYTEQIFNYKCAICGVTNNLCIDHWLPLSKGYPLTKQNAVLMCSRCNSTKKNKMPYSLYDTELIRKIEKILGI